MIKTKVIVSNEVGLNVLAFTNQCLVKAMGYYNSGASSWFCVLGCFPSHSNKGLYLDSSMALTLLT